MKRYENLAHQIAEQIDAGVLRAGERVPSVRRAAQAYKVSPTTVISAYRHLESRGRIRARPRSGYFVNPTWKLPPEPRTSHPPRGTRSVAVGDLVFEILETTKFPAVVPFGSAFIAESAFPLRRLGQFLGRAARNMKPSELTDALPPGHMELRRAIARRYLNVGITANVEEIVITAGALEALYLCLQAVARPGDVVAIESPSFYSTLQALELRGAKALELPTHPGEGIELGSLSAALHRHRISACWLMTTFQNPTGCTMPEEKKKELVKLLAKHDVPLIEDDVYEELYFDPEKPRPAKTFDRKGLVMHVSSFSKCLAPGYRVGWTSAGRFARRVQWVKLMTTLATNICAQAAITRFLREAAYDHYLRGLRDRLIGWRDQLLEAAAQYFPPGTRLTRPHGGYFVWVELPRQVDALKLHRMAMEANISIAPGPIFSAHRRFKNFIRLNYGHPWSPRFERAAEQLGKMIHSLM